MSSNPTSEERSQWLATQLKDLLATPHVHVPDEEGMEMGPGPVDMFSTKFDRLFMPGAYGWVCGERADRQELKESLLGLQRRWNDKEAQCQGMEPTKMAEMSFYPDMAVKMELTPLFMYPAHHETIMAEARGALMQGQQVVAELMLNGDAALFRHES